VAPTLVDRAVRARAVRARPGKANQPYDADTLLHSALGFWRNPPLASGSTSALQTFARTALADARGQKWKQQQYPSMVANALRHLIAVSP
jgi:hypothetical protein